MTRTILVVRADREGRRQGRSHAPRILVYTNCETALIGACLICTGIFMALIPVPAWIPAVVFERRVRGERYFSVGFYNAVRAPTIGVAASITAVAAMRRKLSPAAE